MTENERRALDPLTARDVTVRAVLAVGLILAALAALLALPVA